ncbi:MAG TPA: cupredoxin family copper-binding protein [Myxococcota bacterium]|nr:cupredoxin family copper-binding protein [Myxococcota bacterium]
MGHGRWQDEVGRQRRRRWGSGALWGLLVLAVRASAAGETGAQIEIRNFQFVPATVEVRAGETITWVNDDEEIHSILSGEGLFTSPGLDGEQRFSYRFEKPGTYEYRCALHPQMKGVVVVR